MTAMKSRINGQGPYFKLKKLMGSSFILRENSQEYPKLVLKLKTLHQKKSTPEFNQSILAI